MHNVHYEQKLKIMTFYYYVFVLFPRCSSQGFGWVITTQSPIHRKDDSLQK